MHVSFVPPSRCFALLTSLAFALTLTGAALAADVLPLREGGQLEPPEIEVITSNDNGLRLAIELPALSIEQHSVDGESYQTLVVEGGQLHGNGGAPALPAFTRYVSIPATSGLGLRIASVEEEVLEGIQILPMQDPDATTFQRDTELYARNAWIGEEPVTIGAPSLVRDLRVVPITFHPLQFNPATGQVRVIRRVELALDYVGVDLRNAKQRETIPLTPGFDRLYRSLVVNYDPERYGREGRTADHLGTWVLISRDNSTLTNILQPLIEWREKMGFNVVHVTTAETGTNPSSIRNWLTNAYNTWEDPPEYICIVGDATGTFAIGTFHENWSGYYNGEGDHPYCQLTGDDLMPDAFIGRLSAEDYTTIERIVNKITGYERTPYTSSDPEWFARACLTGDPTYSGISCVHVQQWVKERMRILGYARIDTVFTSPFESGTISKLNQGNNFFGYRGYYQMSGISAGDIAALQNGWKLTYAVNLTCSTGSWESGTSRNEAWLRGGYGTDQATGGIGSIGTATTGTHTRYNNCFYAGVCFGLFWEEGYRLGINHARGKLEMILNYEDYEFSQAGRYCYWNTLMGDPATDMWTNYPADLTVNYPPTVAVGAEDVTFVVYDDGQPVADAWVYLRKGEEIRIGGYTDATGTVRIPIDTTSEGTVEVVVTGHNLYPYEGSFQIQEANTFVGLFGYEIDDAPAGVTQGNGDGQLNPGETVGISVTLRNFGSQTAEDVVVRVDSDSPYVGWLGATEFGFGDIGGYSIGTSPSPLYVRLAPNCPAGQPIRFDLQITSGMDGWVSRMDVPIEGPELVYDGITLIGLGTRIDPGESGQLEIALRNIGALAAEGPITAMLASESYAIQVTDAAGTFGTILSGAIGSNSSDLFSIYAPADCIPGQMANLRLVLTCNDGTRLSASFQVIVGAADSNDPTGPDAYGYWCYDHTDTGYADAPSYEWIDARAHGQSVGLTDYGWQQDDSRTLDLPFTFTYYGEPFDRVTVCSNGWLSMGHTYLENYRNWHLPSGVGPAYMICGFWDNLYQSGSDATYYWYDEDNHRFVVAWDQVRNEYSNSRESFEIILYDPAHHPTATGDGIIEVMYETINDNDSQQMYSTAGIQDGEHTTGITYTYFHQRPATAAPFSSGLALRYTTGAPGFTGVSGRPGDTRLLLTSGPNPWRAGTTIRFQLAEPQAVTLKVFDIDGRIVRTLARGPLPAGAHRVDWNGTSDAGAPLPSGVYYYRLETPGETKTRETLLVR